MAVAATAAAAAAATAAAVADAASMMVHVGKCLTGSSLCFPLSITTMCSGGFGGGGFGGGGGGGGFGGGGGSFGEGQLGAGLGAVNWGTHQLPAFEKNFYVVCIQSSADGSEQPSKCTHLHRSTPISLPSQRQKCKHGAMSTKSLWLVLTFLSL